MMTASAIGMSLQTGLVITLTKLNLAIATDNLHILTYIQSELKS